MKTHRTVRLFLMVSISVSWAALLPTPANAQETAPSDSAAVDTVRNPVIPVVGTLDDTRVPPELQWMGFLRSDVRSTADPLRLLPGILFRDPGGPGLPQQLVVNGVDGRGLAVLLDGRPFRNPVTGTFHLQEIPIEAVDHLDLRMMGSLAPAPGGTSGMMNVVTRHFNTNRPVTKIRFIQGPYDHLTTDVFYTQNVIRDLNVQIGLFREARDNRFVNSSYDAWGVRSRVRYNISDRLNVSLSDLYRRWTVGMNNGIDEDSTAALGLNRFNDAEAVVLSDAGSELRTRRDMTLSATARLLPDSASVTQVHVYFTTSEREYSDRTGRTSTDYDSYAFEVHGAALHQMMHLGPFHGFAGLQTERRIAGLGPAGVAISTMSAWYADASLDGGIVVPSVRARGESNGDAANLSWGAQVRLNFGTIDLQTGFSEISRHPTFQELHWPLYRFFGERNLLEQHRRMHVSIDARAGSASFMLTASDRRIENALLFRAVSTGRFPDVALDVLPSLRIRQVAGSLTWDVLGLQFKGGATWTEAVQTGFAHPRWILTGEVAYSADSLLEGALGATIGIQSRFVTRHTAVRYFPSRDIYAEVPGRLLRTFSTLDLFGVFHLGDAFVSLVWENPLGREYMTVYPYPAMGRNIRVGVNWVFLD